MITVVFSDLHGNLPALTKLSDLHQECNHWLSLGDNVNYGPWGDECVQFIEKELDCRCLRGNHEEYFLSGVYPGKNIVARAFFEFCYEQFTQHKIIEKYLDSIDIGSYHCTHTVADKYIFHDTDVVIDKNYLIGHSHQQYAVSRGAYSLINPGSLGQDRKYINRANYGLYNHETDSFELRYLTYDIDIVVSEMKNQKYPQICIDYYQNKERMV
jgi:predicted phosphodiesterase